MENSKTKLSIFTNENYNEVKRIAQRYFPDAEEAADLVQEFFIKVLSLVDAHAFVWQGRKQFWNWCHKTIRNMALGKLRSERRHHAIEQELFPQNTTEGSADISIEAASDLGDLLQGSLRLCYILHYLEGQDYEEIARSQGLAVSTVRSQCSRAKKAVSKYLL